MAIADRQVARYERDTSRDSETGIMRGAEPRALGPEHGARAILFVHGFSGCPNNFHDLPDRVAQTGWHVRVMLLPGHGRTPHAMERTTAAQLLDGVLHELRPLRDRFSRVVLLGHSMGGALATLAAAQLPLDGLILASPYYRVRHKWYYGLTPERWARAVSPLIRWVPTASQPVNLRESEPKILSYRWTPTRAALTAIELAAAARAPEILRRIACPSLLIHSEIDNVTCPHAARTAFAQIAAAEKREVWLHRSDHVIFWDYEADATAAAVLAFLEQYAGARNRA